MSSATCRAWGGGQHVIGLTADIWGIPLGAEPGWMHPQVPRVDVP